MYILFIFILLFCNTHIGRRAVVHVVDGWESHELIIA